MDTHGVLPGHHLLGAGLLLHHLRDKERFACFSVCLEGGGEERAREPPRNSYGFAAAMQGMRTLTGLGNKRLRDGLCNFRSFEQNFVASFTRWI